MVLQYLSSYQVTLSDFQQLSLLTFLHFPVQFSFSVVCRQGKYQRGGGNTPRSHTLSADEVAAGEIVSRQQESQAGLSFAPPSPVRAVGCGWWIRQVHWIAGVFWSRLRSISLSPQSTAVLANHADKLQLSIFAPQPMSLKPLEKLRQLLVPFEH